jgi:hypothetical protein
VRAGNPAITINEARGVAAINNTIVDAGYINRLIDQDTVVGSPWVGFFSGQGLPADFRVSSGGFRLSGTDDVTIANNLVSISGARLFAVDASANVTDVTAEFRTNLMVGGDGLRLRSQDVTLADGFQAITDPGFRDQSNGDYRLEASSIAIDSGTNTLGVTTDFNGTFRADGNIDVGAFEYAPASLTVPRAAPDVIEATDAAEPTRICRRLQLLRDWSHDESHDIREVFLRGA